jgi:hypothetical protein
MRTQLRSARSPQLAVAHLRDAAGSLPSRRSSLAPVASPDRRRHTGRVDRTMVSQRRFCLARLGRFSDQPRPILGRTSLRRHQPLRSPRRRLPEGPFPERRAKSMQKISCFAGMGGSLPISRALAHPLGSRQHVRRAIERPASRGPSNKEWDVTRVRERLGNRPGAVFLTWRMDQRNPQR